MRRSRIELQPRWSRADVTAARRLTVRLHRDGLGVGWLPARRTAALLEHGELVARRTTDPREPNTLYAAWCGDQSSRRALSGWLEPLRRPRLGQRLVRGLDGCA